jgi:hypothetical protein
MKNSNLNHDDVLGGDEIDDVAMSVDNEQRNLMQNEHQGGAKRKARKMTSTLDMEDAPKRRSKRKSSKKGSKKGSKKASSKRRSKRRSKQTGGEDDLVGGKRRSKKGSKKGSKKTSKRSSKRRSKQAGGEDELVGGKRRSKKGSKKAPSKRKSKRRSKQTGGDDNLGDELVGGKKRSKKGSKKGSKKASSKKRRSRKGSKQSRMMQNDEQDGGKRKSKSSSKSGSKKRSSQKRQLHPSLAENIRVNKIISEKVGYSISPALITYVARKFGDTAKASVKDPKDYKAINKKKLELFEDYLAKNSKSKLVSEIEKVGNDLKAARKKNSKK